MEPQRATRQPSAAYAGSNGFIPKFSDSDRLQDGPELEAASDAYRRARFVLDFKKRPLPSKAQLSEEVDGLKAFPPPIPERPPIRNWDGELAFLNKREQKAKERYLSDLGTLAAIQADEYKEELRHRHFSRVEEDYEPSDPGYPRLQAIYSDASKSSQTRRAWNNELEMLDYAYFSQRADIANDRYSWRRSRDEDRLRKDREFPLSVEAFNSKRQDFQLRVARYLTADAIRKHRMMREFSWNEREVKFLEEEFAKNDSEFTKRIKDMIASEQAVRDPRRRA